MDERDLAGCRQVRVPDGVLEREDQDDCPFCLGRSAAHRGEPAEANPFPPTGSSSNSLSWYESDVGSWGAGYSLGAIEQGRLLWFERPDLGTEE